MLSVDENVGRLLDALDRDGLSENTIVIYTSDNGFFLGEHGLFDKRLMYEPSIRVPMLVRFPARVRAGVVDRSHMVLNVDVAPTLLELCDGTRDVPAILQGLREAGLVSDDVTVADVAHLVDVMSAAGALELSDCPIPPAPV